MVQWWGRGRAKGQTETWPPGGRPTVLPWPGEGVRLVRPLIAWLRGCAVVETIPGRLFPWMPVAFAIGIALYFAAEREPQWWAGSAVALGSAIVAVLARARPIAFPVMLAVTAISAGFAGATLKALHIAHPVLQAPAGNVRIAGFVEARQERERTDRIVVRAVTVEGIRSGAKPDRVRVSVRKGTAPPVGGHVEFRARLNPPLAPLRPGGYDFARDLYFQGIGAVGFALGPIKVTEATRPPDWPLRLIAQVEALRDAINSRIRAAVPGDAGAIASALITGKRDAISAPVNEAMYVSSLAHVLSISGYHMAVVAGVIFFALRALLALSPTLASSRPIKKWAAAAALVAAAGYLVLSGAEVATQRAFIMTAIVLIGVMTDRAALTLRTLAVAALAVLLLAPQALVHPSFQMSFAATLALVAVYERSLRWQPNSDTGRGARIALWGGNAVLSLIVASLVAGLATTPFAAFHFHRIAPYGILANLAAMPIVSVWVMPSGLLALAVMPFGFDGPLWRLMGEGISWMAAIALWVAALPGAVGRVTAFGIAPLLVCTAGIAAICLLKTALRWSGAVLIAIAAVLAVRTPQPDVLIAADGRTLAVRGFDGRLSVMRQGGDTFTVRHWLAADGDARQPADPDLRRGFACDASGCVARLSDGRFIAYSIAADAVTEDCERAAVVVTTRQASPGCAAAAFDRDFLRGHGATALGRNGQGWAIAVARAPGEDRPWARPSVPPPVTSARRPQPRDATPRPEDLEPGD